MFLTKPSQELLTKTAVSLVYDFVCTRQHSKIFQVHVFDSHKKWRQQICDIAVRCSFVWDTCHILWHGSPSGLRLLLELPHIWLGLSDKVLKILQFVNISPLNWRVWSLGLSQFLLDKPMVLPGESAVSRSTRSVKWARTELGLS
jgi:hypothetical protein